MGREGTLASPLNVGHCSTGTSSNVFIFNFIFLYINMLKISLIILALIGLLATTTHYAFAFDMPSGGSNGPSDNSQSNTATESPSPHVDFPEGWLAGHEKYGGPGGYGLWRHEHHHLWGSDFWRDQRLRNQDYYWNKYMNELDREHIHPLNAPIVTHHHAFEYPAP